MDIFPQCSIDKLIGVENTALSRARHWWHREVWWRGDGCAFAAWRIGLPTDRAAPVGDAGCKEKIDVFCGRDPTLAACPANPVRRPLPGSLCDICYPQNVGRSANMLKSTIPSRNLINAFRDFPNNSWPVPEKPIPCLRSLPKAAKEDPIPRRGRKKTRATWWPRGFFHATALRILRWHRR